VVPPHRPAITGLFSMYRMSRALGAWPRILRSKEPVAQNFEPLRYSDRFP
jgi:hypothetical protein